MSPPWDGGSLCAHTAAIPGPPLPATQPSRAPGMGFWALPSPPPPHPNCHPTATPARSLPTSWTLTGSVLCPQSQLVASRSLRTAWAPERTQAFGASDCSPAERPWANGRPPGCSVHACAMGWRVSRQGHAGTRRARPRPRLSSASRALCGRCGPPLCPPVHLNLTILPAWPSSHSIHRTFLADPGCPLSPLQGEKNMSGCVVGGFCPSGSAVP